MTPSPSKMRSLKHFRETAHLHWHYMGLGFLLTLSFLVGISINLAQFLDSQKELIELLDESLQSEFLLQQRVFLNMFWFQVILFLIALLALLQLNSHRIAGPYLALKRTFRIIREGKTSEILKFRQYDKLDDVADDFNQMMDTLEAQMHRKSPAPPENPSERSPS